LLITSTPSQNFILYVGNFGDTILDTTDLIRKEVVEAGIYSTVNIQQLFKGGFKNV
jgi:hypothetical protein